MNKLIAQRYRLDSELGSGGMGIVFRATDLTTNMPVAVKQLKTEVAHAEVIERFKREGEALRDLNHPNIVKMLDAIEEESNYYLVMEYITGSDLKVLIEKRGQLDYETCLKMAIDLADALTRAHKLNIIHRDLKPANILVSEDSVLHLTDFGVAHMSHKERVTETNAIIGTLDYLPPEVFNGDTLDTRADIWAFGVILFEMLTGQKLFSSRTYIETIQAITLNPLPELETLAPSIPNALIDLVYRMLARNPQERIPSVRLVGAELEAILAKRESAILEPRFETPTGFNPPKHNFPVQTTAFIGREEEIKRIAQYFADSRLRLLSIIGQGGMGKTRLMLEVAWRLMQEENYLLPEPPAFYADGVYFVDLAPLSARESIVTAIADAVGYSFQTDGRSPRQQVMDFLRPKQLGLLMDNFEHLLDGAELITEILQYAPHIRITVTSRERLNLSDEVVFYLEGLDFPDWETPEDALQYSAVKLFLQSAQRVNPAFQLQAEDLPYVARISKLAQGSPLAIVLAASWLQVLSVQEVSEEMANTIDFLETELRDIPARQRSMRAIMDYSWHQLSSEEQLVFAKLSIFRGGFTREAAISIANANVKILLRLVNKSLLRRNAETARYEIHELLRQYAAEKLAHQPDNEKDCQARYTSYFADYLEDQWQSLRSHKLKASVHQIKTELDNIRFVWQLMLSHNRVAEIDKSLLSLWWFLFQANLPEEGLEWFTSDVFKKENSTIDPSYTVFLNVQAAKSWFLLLAGKSKSATELISQTVQALPSSIPAKQRVLPLICLCQVLLYNNKQADLHQAGEQVQLLGEELKDDWVKSSGIIYIAYAAIAVGNLELSQKSAEACLKIMETLGDPFGLGATHRVLGNIALAQGRYKDAKKEMELALAFHKQINQQYVLGFAHHSLFLLALNMQDYDEALIQSRHRLVIYQSNGQHWDMVNVLSDIATVFERQGMMERSVELLTCLIEYATASEHRENAMQRREELAKNLSNEQYQNACENGKQLEFNQLVSQLIEEFAP